MYNTQRAEIVVGHCFISKIKFISAQLDESEILEISIQNMSVKPSSGWAKGESPADRKLLKNVWTILEILARKTGSERDRQRDRDRERKRDGANEREEGEQNKRIITTHEL